MISPSDPEEVASKRKCEMLFALTHLMTAAEFSSGELCEVFAALVKTCPLLSEKERAMIGRDILRQFSAIDGSRVDWLN